MYIYTQLLSSYSDLIVPTHLAQPGKVLRYNNYIEIIYTFIGLLAKN